MPTKYFLKDVDNNTDCSGGGDTYDLDTTQGTGATVSSTTSAGAFEDMFTFDQFIDTVGTTGDHDVSVDVSAATLVTYRFRIQEISSLGTGCTVLNSSAWSTTRVGSTGIQTETLNLTWSTGNRLRLQVQGFRTSGHGNKTLTINVNDADSFIDAPWGGGAVTLTKTVDIDAKVLATLSKTVDVDAKVFATLNKTVDVDAKVQAVLTKTVDIDAKVFAADLQKTVDIEARVQDTLQKTVDIEAVVLVQAQKTVDIDAKVFATLNKTVDIEARVLSEGLVKTVDIDAVILVQFQKTVDIEARVLATLTKTIDVDAKVLDTLSKSVNIDAQVASQFQKSLDIDAKVFRANIPITVNIDAVVVDPGAGVATANWNPDFDPFIIHAEDC